MSDEEEISVYDEVEIEDMTYDEALQTYFYPCPCGDRFQIALADLQDEETDIAVCPSCSLMIRVIYEVVSFSLSLPVDAPLSKGLPLAPRASGRTTDGEEGRQSKAHLRRSREGQHRLTDSRVKPPCGTARLTPLCSRSRNRTISPGPTTTKSPTRSPPPRSPSPPEPSAIPGNAHDV